MYKDVHLFEKKMISLKRDILSAISFTIQDSLIINEVHNKYRQELKQILFKELFFLAIQLVSLGP